MNLLKQDTHPLGDYPTAASPRTCYCAGYFDGEGCIYMAGEKLNHLAACIVSGDQKSLQMFSAEFGGDVRRVDSHSRGALIHLYRWRLHGKRAIAMLTIIEPFLLAKREQARLVIESGWQDFNGNIRGVRKGSIRVTAHQMAIRRKLKLALRTAKNSGRKLPYCCDTVRDLQLDADPIQMTFQDLAPYIEVR